VPACFISGAADWGVYQRPGAAERMRQQACTRMSGFHLVPGAGHWVQQERSGEVVRLLLQFLKARAPEA
jgi:pimeloyl-ACP methyl ester carboxylesterase